MTMAGYGLTNAVQQFQQGKQFTQGLKDAEQRRSDQANDRAFQEEARGRQRQQWGDEDQRRATAEAARQAFTGVVDASKAEWALNGAQGEYRPNDTTMFKAAEAAGAAFAKAGDWEGYLRNETAVQGQRTRVRTSALQRYEQDGDIETLARTVYPTVFDGKEIAAVEKIPGAEGGRGREPSPGKVRIKLSDGTTHDMQPNEIVTMVKQSLIDPAKAAEQEIMLNLARAKRDIETQGQIDVERVRGEEARKTAETRTTGTLAAVNARTEGAKEVAKIRVNGSVSVAQLRGKGGSGGGGRGLSSAGSKAPSVQSRMTDDQGNVILVMRDGTHKALVGDDGRPVKSIDYQKLVGSTAAAISKNDFSPPAEARAAAKKMLEPDRPATPATGLSGAKDYRNLWSK